MARSFKELNATKTLEVLIGKVFKEIMKISDDFLVILDGRISKGDLEAMHAKTILKIMYRTIQYLEIFGTILDYICFDSYKFETIVESFSQ